ncbi:hypothetical protein BGI41_07735 [Methanobrevibacter sp. 87.7]|nr:hypothetical protein BGI41_07735 [Methanobrevibacter sp. 87.7]
MLIIFIICILALNPIAATENSSDWKTQKVENVNFKLAPQYENGELVNSKYYTIKNMFIFSIRYIDSDSFLKSSYGDDASSEDTHYIKNKNIKGHNSSIIYQERNIDGVKYNTTYIYFPIKDEIYCISYNGSNITQDIEEMIKNTPKQTMSEKKFYSKLTHATVSYEYSQREENSYNDYYYRTPYQYNNQNKNQWGKYYLAYSLGRSSRYYY